MALAGYSSTVKIAGAAVVMTGEACSLVSAGVYRVTNTAKRVIDPATSVVVKDGGVAVSTANYAVNYLHGTITFSVAPSGAVTVDGAYLPLLTFAEVRELTLSVQGSLADSTSLDSAGYKAKALTLKDFTASLTSYQSAFYDNDPGAGSRIVSSLHANGTPVLIEFGFGAYLFRGWALIENFEEKGSLDGLTELSLSLTGTAIAATGTTSSAAFGWNS